MYNKLVYTITKLLIKHVKNVIKLCGDVWNVKLSIKIH